MSTFTLIRKEKVNDILGTPGGKDIYKYNIDVVLQISSESLATCFLVSSWWTCIRCSPSSWASPPSPTTGHGTLWGTSWWIPAPPPGPHMVTWSSSLSAQWWPGHCWDCEACDWSRRIIWLEYWPLIGWDSPLPCDTQCGEENGKLQCEASRYNGSETKQWNLLWNKLRI